VKTNRNLIGAALFAASSFFWPAQAFAQAEVAAEICNEAGVCAPIDPLTALIIIGVKTIGDEVDKGDKGFGPNGAILKAINTVLGDLQRGGLGPNNDLVKAWETMRKDVLEGPGKNNDVIRAIGQMGIKL
jgi:hypothetical protein